MKTPREILLESNPFFSSSTSNPWDDQYPDVPSINGDAFDGVVRLIAHKSANPSDGCAGLVLGEAGAGKSHLLKRALHATRRTETPAAFTYVPPILDPAAPMRYLLREIVTSLCKELDDKQTRSQLDLFAAHILIDFLRNGQDPKRNARLLQKLDVDPYYIYSSKFDGPVLAEAEKRAIRYLRKTIQQLQPDLLRAIVKYRKKDLRDLVVCWLRGDVLDDDEVALLGVTSRADKKDGALEAEARVLILSLGCLMARYKRPMLVCFDQLDTVQDPKGVRALEAMIHLLVNHVPAMLPVAFVRADSWNRRFEKVMDPAVTGRLNTNRFLMQGCSKDQAKELIFRRVQFLLGRKSDGAFTWLWEQLEPRIKEGYSPRQVIVLANRAITAPPPETKGGKKTAHSEPDISQALLETYMNEVEVVLSDLDSWSPDGDRLELALSTYLACRAGVTNLRKGKVRYMTRVFKAPGKGGKPVPNAVIVNVGGGHQRAGACLRRGIEFLEKYPDGRCWYVSDARTPFPRPPRWRTTNKRREEFERKGGVMLLLAKEDLAQWYGLTSLVFKINEGDVQVEDASGALRSATRDELDAMLESTIKNGSFPPMLAVAGERGSDSDSRPVNRPAKPPAPPPPPPSGKCLHTSICTCLAKSPMRTMTIAMLLGKLGETSVRVDHAELLDFIRRNKQSFLLFENKQGMTVMLAKA